MSDMMSAIDVPDSPSEPVLPRRRVSPAAGRFIGGVGLLALIGLCIAGFIWWQHGRFQESTNNAYLQADQVVIAPRIPGYVDQVLIDDNQEVKAGQALVRIDPRGFRSASAQDDAMVGARAADVDRAIADAQRHGALVDQEQGQLDAAVAHARSAAADADRYRALAEGGADTVQKRDQAVSARDEAQAQVRAQQAALKANELQAASLDAQIRQARAALAGAKATSLSAGVDLQSTIIRSPIDGRVGDRTVRVGQFAQPGTRLMDIAPVRNIYLVANFKETQIRRMRVGQPVEVHIDALDGIEIHGRVESFAPGTGAQFALLPPQNATGNFTKIVQRVSVRIAIDVPPSLRDHLLPGLSAEVSVDTRDGGDGR